MHRSIHRYIAFTCSVGSSEMHRQAVATVTSVSSATQTHSHQPERTDVPTRFQAELELRLRWGVGRRDGRRLARFPDGITRLCKPLCYLVLTQYKAPPDERITRALLYLSSTRWEFDNCQIRGVVTKNLYLRILAYSRVFMRILYGASVRTSGGWKRGS